MITFVNFIASDAQASPGATVVGIGLTQEEIAALADPGTRTPIVAAFRRFGTVVVFLAEQSDAVMADLDKGQSILMEAVSMHEGSNRG